MIRQILIVGLYCLLIAGWAYWIAACILMRNFFRRAALDAAGVKTLDQAEKCNSDVPRVSILKPVKGADQHTFDNFVNFCRQEYPSYEILFGIADASDPAVKIIRRLQEQFPDIPIRLIVSQGSGINPKCAILEKLTHEARGEILVLSDDDIRVGTDYLARVVAPLGDPAIGWVTCPYYGLFPGTFAGRLAALHMEALFLPAIILAHAMGQQLGMGATMAVRRSDLLRAGGFEKIANHLLDDYELASIIAGLNLGGCVCTYIVGSTLGRTTIFEQWGREIRWSRGIRVTCPSKYWGWPVTYPIVWAIALVIATAFGKAALILLGLTLAMRWLIALSVHKQIHGRARANMLLLAARETLSFLIWCGGLWGRNIEWRGRRFVLHRDGTLAPSDAAADVPNLFSTAVRRLDRFLRHREGIFEFDTSEDCILRASFGVCDTVIQLTDGTVLSPGDALCDLHLFNEHIPRVGANGPDIAWAALAQSRVRHSLATLAALFESDGRFDAIKGVRGNSSFLPTRGIEQLKRMAVRLHFDVFDVPPPKGMLKRLHQFGEDLLVWALVMTFNRKTRRGARIRRERHLLCISRKALLQRYLPTARQYQLTASSNP